MRPPRAGGRREGREVDALDSRHAPLRDRVERAERLDLVAEEIDADRPVPVGGEKIDDAAAPGKRARCVDGVDELPAPCGEPLGEFVRVEPAADGEPSRTRLDLAGVGERHEQRLNAGHHERRPRRVRHRQPLDERQSFRLGRVVAGGVVVAEALDGRQEHGRDVAEQPEVIQKVVCLRGMRQDDDERAGFRRPGPGERRHGERRRRSPGSADRPAMPLSEAGDHVDEPAV